MGGARAGGSRGELRRHAGADGIASYFIPDWLDRSINVVIDDGDITDWAMGAIGSAVVFVPET